MQKSWYNNSIATKISSGVMGVAMFYLFVYDGESFGGWTIFFISLVLTILFHAIDEQHKEIQAMRDEKMKDGNVDENAVTKK